jgi:hypothetical protein
MPPRARRPQACCGAYFEALFGRELLHEEWRWVTERKYIKTSKAIFVVNRKLSLALKKNSP